MFYLSAYKNAKRTVIILTCLTLLILILSVQAQDVSPTDGPGETPIATESPAVEPLLTEMVTVVPTEATPLPTLPTSLPTQEIIPSPTDAIAIPTEEPTHIATQESTALPTEDTTMMPTSEASPVETATPINTETSLGLAFSASFDAAYPAELSAKTGWIDVIVTNGKALQANIGAVPVTYTAATFADSAVEAHFLLNAGEGQVMLRGYIAGLNVDGTVTLSHNQMAVSFSTAALTSGQWANLKLQIIGSQIQVSVDDVLIIDYTESAEIASGMAGFAASSGAVLRIDDFAIYGVPTAVIPVISETPVVGKMDVEVAIPMAGEPLNVPTNVVLTGNGTSVDITWDDTNLGETGYEIERYVSDVFPNSIIGTTSADAQAFTEANVGCGLTLWYRVRAVRATDSTTSDWSAWMSVTTAPCTAVCHSLDAVRRVNVGTDGTYQTSGLVLSLGRSMSATADRFVFGSLNPLEDATNELSSENNVPGMTDVYDYSTACATTKRSVGAIESAQVSEPGGISLDGNVVAFETTSAGLVPDDNDNFNSVFLRQNDVTTRFTPAGGHVNVVDIDYPYVLMSTFTDITSMQGTGLVNFVEDLNDASDLILYDVEMNTSRAITNGLNTPYLGAAGGRVLIADNGTVYILFNTLTPMFGTGDSNNVTDVYLQNMTNGNTTRMSVTDTEGQFSTASLLGGFSLVGNTLKVSFQTASRETAVAGGPTRIFVRTVNLATPNLGTTMLVSRATGATGTIAATSSYGGMLSGDGRWIVFSTADSNMVPADTNAVADVFVRDLTSYSTKRISLTSGGAQLTKASTAVDISDDGKKILFSTADSTVVDNDTANVCETDFADSSPAAGMQYDYNDNCTDLFVTSNPLTFSTTPTNLTATALAPNKIHLSWGAVSSVQGFTVEASYNNGTNWTSVATVNDGSATSYDLSSTCSITFMVRLSSYVMTPYPLTSSPSAGVTAKTTTCVGPTLLLPVDKAYLNTIPQALTWSSPDPNVYGYDTDVSTSPTFATYTRTSSGATGIWTGALADGTYYWRVRTNAPGIGAFSAIRSFTIDTVAPAAPAITSPENLSVLSSSPVTLTWGIVPGTKYYKLRLNDGVYDDVYTQSLTTPSYSIGSDVAQGQYTMTVTAVDAALNESPAASITFTLNPALTPADNAIVTSTAGTANVTFTWKGLGASGAHTYTVYLYSDQSLTTLVDLCQSTTVFTCTIPNIAEGVYYWRVLRDAESLGIGTSVSNKLYVSPTLPAPTQLFPLNNAYVTPSQNTGGYLTLDWGWGASTPDGGSFTYEVDVNTSSTFAVESSYSRSNLTGPLSNDTYLADGTYYWRVRATNSLGAVSAWSPTYKFVMDNVAPATPNLVTPAASVLIQTARPTLTWTGPTDAYRYEVEVNDSCDDHSALYNSGPTITAKTFTIPTPLSQGAQQLCVKAYDINMNESSFSGHPVNLFLGTAPANNAFVPVTTKPTFTWAATTGTTSLTLEYDTDSNFSNPTSIPVTGVSKTLDSALTPGVYYWRVRRQGETFVGNPYRTLYVGALLAGSTPLLPVNATSYDAATPSVNLTWQDVDPAPMANLDITDYEVVISKSATFTLPETHTVAEGAQTYLWMLPAQQNRVTYYWHVRALANGLPISNWSATRSFIVDNFTPAVPTITSPKSSDLINTVRPIFTWGAVAGATSYRVSIMDMTESTDLVSDTIVTTPSFTPPTNLTQNTLKFTVTAIHNQNDGPTAEVTFRVSLGTNPANNTAIATPKPVFTWLAASGTGVKYTLEVANNLAFSPLVFSQSNISATTYTPTIAQAQALTTAGAGIYYWRVTHTGINGTSISTARAFTYIVTGQPLNLAARINGVAGVVDTAKVFNSMEDAPIGLTWDAPATPAAPTGYSVEIATNATFTTGLVTHDVGMDLSYPIPEGTLTDGLKYWRVKALYSADGTSAIYSASSSFTLDTVSPTQPTTSLAFADKTTVRPTLTWSNSGVGVRYRLTLYLYTFSDVTVVPGYEDVIVPVTSYTPTNPLPQVSAGTYRWDIKAEDSAGNLSSGFGSTLPMFQISLNTSPSNQSFTTDTTPTFTWTGVTGVGISTVRVQVATDATMNTLVYDSGDLIEPISTHTLPVLNALPKDAIYYWRVLRAGDNPTQVYGKLFVVVSSLASVTPVITGPTDNILLGTPQTQANPFTWTVITPPTALSNLGWVYMFETFYTPPTATSIPYRGLNAGGTSFNGGGNPDGTYYWRVRPWFAGASFAGPPSGYRKFTIDTTPPSVPAMTLPVEKAVITTTRRPTFNWAASTGGATKYVFELSTASDFSTVRYTATYTVPTTLVLPVSQALPNGTYYWRVVSQDSLGNKSNTLARQFRIAVP